MIVNLSAILLILTLSEGLPAGPPEEEDKECLDLPPYNNTYPFTKPEETEQYTKWKIAIISDRDRASKISNKNEWESRLKTGYLTITWNPRSANIEWDSSDRDKFIIYDLSQRGRGMELSELVVFDGKLFTCDDKTGMVYQIMNDGASVLPFVHLNDGNGQENYGFKCEWMAVKDKMLWIGSTGREWTTTTGEFMNHDPEWIKVVDRLGLVKHVNWTDNYLALRDESGYGSPGYFIHESAVWSDVHKQWFFLPRKVSKEKYDDKKDETRCGNLLLRTDEKFTKVIVEEIGLRNTSRGFSSFKFIPNSKDQLFVALKTIEIGTQVESYIGVFNIGGQVLLNDVFISNEKFEGIEFI